MFAPNEQGLDLVKYPLKYEIIVDLLGEQVKDVTSFTVVRSPLNKTASFAMMTINIRPTQFFNIDDRMKNNELEFLKVSINIVRPYDTPNSFSPPKVDELTTKTYLVLKLEKLESDSIDSSYFLVQLYLMNPIIYYLETTNGYNKILEDKTTLEAILDFENFIKSSHGSKTFNFVKVGDNIEVNNHRYEQILTRQKCDLLIPNHLIMGYKPFHTFNYYFFDEFKLDKNSNGDITCWLVNLGDINSFNKVSMSNTTQSESSITNTLVEVIPVNDVFNDLFQKYSSLTVKSYDCEFGFRKAYENREMVISKVKDSSTSSNTSRNPTAIRTDIAIKSHKPTEQTVIYAPDSVNNGMKRFDAVSGQFRNRIHSLETYYMADSHPDFLQFNNCYDLSPLAPKQFDYVPITIINSFIRDTSPVPMFIHQAKYQMIKFRPEKFDGGKHKTGKNFEDYPMT